RRRGAFERFAPDEFVGLMRLVEVARSADQRTDFRTLEPSAVRSKQYSPGLSGSRCLEQRGLQRSPTWRIQRRHYHRRLKLDLRSMLAGRIVVQVDRRDTPLDFAIQRNRIHIGHRSIAELEQAFFGD